MADSDEYLDRLKQVARAWAEADQRTDIEEKLPLLDGLSDNELRAVAGGLAQSAVEVLREIGVLSEPR